MGQMIGLARLGRDSEVRYTPAGDAVSNLSLAMDYRTKDGKATQWVDGSMWGKMAEALDPYLTKGKLVFVVLDDVHIEEFKRADGSPGTKLAGRVSKLDLAGGGDGSGDAPAPPPPARRTPAPARAPAAKSGTGFDDMDDDIPF